MWKRKPSQTGIFHPLTPHLSVCVPPQERLTVEAPKRHKVSVHVLSREMDSCEYLRSRVGRSKLYFEPVWGWAVLDCVCLFVFTRSHSGRVPRSEWCQPGPRSLPAPGTIMIHAAPFTQCCSLCSHFSVSQTFNFFEVSSDSGSKMRLQISECLYISKLPTGSPLWLFNCIITEEI